MADYGCLLDREEQQRRYVLKSLLRVDGLDLKAYALQFGTDPFIDLPELSQIETEGLGFAADNHLRLNAHGLELSDVIGPWLFSETMKQRMEGFALT
jgi:oxygen-independent coproporphyrinogen-3 oxidase